MAIEAQQPPAQSEAQQPPAQSEAPAGEKTPSVDPDTAADILAVVFSQAVQDGMDPNFKTIMFASSEKGDVSVVSESAAGAKYEGMMPADDIAAALGMDAQPAE